MILHVQLRSLLENKDMTVAQLARATHISPKTLYQWLYGQKPRNLDQVKKVADHFQVSIDYLAFGTHPAHTFDSQDLKKEINAGIYEVILRKIRNHHVDRT